MTESPHDLEGRLRDLPRATAGHDLTARVLDGLPERRRAARRRRRRGAALLAATLAFATLATAWWARQLRVEGPDAARRAQSGDPGSSLERLRIEHRRLETELAELRALAATEEPFVYLGSADDFDMVVAVGSLPAAAGRARPAADRDPSRSQQ